MNCQDKCSVEGCEKPVDRKGMCATHYMRFWRNNTTDIIRKPRKATLDHSGGYVLVYCGKDHILSDDKGYTYQHRKIYFDNHGAGPFVCKWCGKPVDWNNLHIDHLDDNKTNNTVDNLVASCPRCNQQRGHHKAIATWRSKTGIRYKDGVYSMEELAGIAGISRQSLISRIKKGMTIDDAVETPRGKSGPK